MIDHSGNEPLHFLVLDVRPGHGKCLARTGLAVGKDRSIEALQHRFYDLQTCLFENHLLSGVHIEDSIEIESQPVG